MWLRIATIYNHRTTLLESLERETLTLIIQGKVYALITSTFLFN